MKDIDIYYVLQFKTDTGKMITLRVRKASDSVTDEEAKDAMDKIFDANAFPTIYGDLTEKVSLRKYTVSETPYTISEE
ncbi:MAG: DUF2922 domain-containing protein [Clostridiales bacterium]|nr:DUF2922 domain-containing protein [Clostridiales bacterium]